MQALGQLVIHMCIFYYFKWIYPCHCLPFSKQHYNALVSYNNEVLLYGPQEVLEKASGGCALKGVNKTGDENEETNELLLKMSPSVTLNNAKQDEQFAEVQVQSREEEKMIKKYVSKKGFSQLFSSDVSYLTVGVGIGVQGRLMNRTE